MIEKLARAIGEAYGADWDLLGKGDRNTCHNYARAVLTALREPDEGMLRAVDDEDADPIVARGRAYSAWTSMIDHILQEADRD